LTIDLREKADVHFAKLHSEEPPESK